VAQVRRVRASYLHTFTVNSEDTMRTVIYVHEPSAATIRAKDARDASALLCRYNQGVGQPAVGLHQLDPGIYMIISSGELEVSGSHLEVVVLHNDKDIPPDPKTAILALEPGATVQSIQLFLVIAKDISVDDADDDVARP
jgi:hypothetical protein